MHNPHDGFLMGCTLCDHNGVTLTAVHPSSFQIWCRCHTVVTNVTNDIDTCKRMILRYFSAKILGSNCNLSLDEQPCERVEFLQAANLLKATAGVGQHHELWVWGHSHPPQVKLSDMTQRERWWGCQYWWCFPPSDQTSVRRNHQPTTTGEFWWLWNCWWFVI